MKPCLAIVTHIKVTAFHIKHTCVCRSVSIFSKGSVNPPTRPLRAIARFNLRYLVLPLLLLALPIPTRATSIVIRKTATDIFVGADSKESYPTGQPDSLSDKIVLLKENWYLAAAGKFEIRDRDQALFGKGQDLFGSIDFDIFSAAKLCSTSKPTLREFADSCSAKIQEELIYPLQLLHMRHTKLYLREIPPHRVILQLAFFGREDGKLKAYFRDIFPYGPKAMVGATYVKPQNCEATCTGNFVLGIRDVHAARLDRRGYWAIDADTAICKFIALEINNHPKEVGWPVKGLHLTAGGTAEWFTYENACYEKKAPQTRPKTTPVRK